MFYNHIKNNIQYRFDMIITVGNIKGGVGKTTLAVNLAIHAEKNLGKSVVLIDADDQSTATLFTEIREQESEPANYTCVSVRGGQVRSQGLALAKRFDITVIDCGGRDTEAFRAALTICDVLVAPLCQMSFKIDPLLSLKIDPPSLSLSRGSGSVKIPKIHPPFYVSSGSIPEAPALIAGLNNFAVMR